MPIIHPWLSFTYLFLGQDNAAYDCWKYAMNRAYLNPNDMTIFKMPQTQNPQDMYEDICENFSRFLNIFTMANAASNETRISMDNNIKQIYTIILIIVKFRLWKKLSDEEQMWIKTCKQYESAQLESLSGQFYKSKGLMNCVEYFMKGDPKNHKKNKDNQIKQLKYYLRILKREIGEEFGEEKFKNFPLGSPLSVEDEQYTGKPRFSQYVGLGIRLHPPPLSKSIVLFRIRIQVADLFGKIKIKSRGF